MKGKGGKIRKETRKKGREKQKKKKTCHQVLCENRVPSGEGTLKETKKRGNEKGGKRGGPKEN